MLTALHSFTHQLPKVELHAHLLGTVRRDTYIDLARRAGWPMGEDEINDYYTPSDKPKGAIRVLRSLDASLIREPDDLHRLVYEYLQDAAAHKVFYAEFFWNPTGTARESGIAYPRALEAIRRAIVDAQKDHAIIGRLIAAVDREASPEAAVDMVDWVLAHRCDEVIGIGMDYNEVDPPSRTFHRGLRSGGQGGIKTHRACR